jgi:hypothetical protein
VAGKENSSVSWGLHAGQRIPHYNDEQLRANCHRGATMESLEFEWDDQKAARNLPMSVKPMKKKNDALDDELRPEYDSALIRSGVRGKYAARYKAGTNLVPLAPDVAAAFPTAEAVNDALRLLMSVADKVHARR